MHTSRLFMYTLGYPFALLVYLMRMSIYAIATYIGVGAFIIEKPVGQIADEALAFVFVDIPFSVFNYFYSLFETVQAMDSPSATGSFMILFGMLLCVAVGLGFLLLYYVTFLIVIFWTFLGWIRWENMDANTHMWAIGWTNWDKMYDAEVQANAIADALDNREHRRSTKSPF